METKRAAAYLRQSVSEDEGIQRQRARCAALIEARGWQALDPYEDNDTSASKPRETGTAWARMLADIDSGLIEVVVAVNVDRLLRSIGDLSLLLERKVSVVTVEGDLDLSTEAGEFQATMLAAVARMEVRRKASRAAASAATRRAAGHPSPGRVTYGYRWIAHPNRDSSGRRYVVVADEARVVRWMFEEALAGSPLGSICRELNLRGTRTRTGAPWRSATVRRMLLSPYYGALLPPATQGAGTYRAELVDLDKCEPGAWEPLVSEDELRAVRGRLLDPSRLRHNGTARRWLLAGIGRCDICGAPIRSARTRGGVHGYRCPVGHFLRMGDIIDRYVEAVVLDRLSAPDAAGLMAPVSGVDLAALRARGAALQASREELLDLVMSRTYTAADVRSRTAALDAELDQIASQLSAALAVDPVAAVVGAEDVRAAWDGLTLARQRRIVSELLVPVVRQVGKGRRVETLEQATETVAIIWRKPGGSNLALPALVTEAGMGTEPTLSEGARAVLSGQLNGPA